MDEARKKSVAYEYLCHLEEAKVWLEQCLKEPLPPATELEENLRNGVVLAKLGHFLHPELVPLNRIYDLHQRRYETFGLQFKHTDNINYWLKSLEATQLPKTFHPETTDVYDKKNMPRVIYCLHALSRHLFKNGHAPVMNDFYGKIDFSDEEVLAVQDEITERGIKMPAFQKIGELLSGNRQEVSYESIVQQINNAISSKDSQALLVRLKNPAAKVKDVYAHNISEYIAVLHEAKKSKEESSINRSMNASHEPDDFDGLLLLDEIQGYISAVNIKCSLNNILNSAKQHLKENNISRIAEDFLSLFTSLDLKNVNGNNAVSYAESALRSNFSSVNLDDITDIKWFLQTMVNETNDNIKKSSNLTTAVSQVNEALDRGTVFDLMKALKSPALGLNQSKIDDFSAPLYFEEMKVDKTDLNCDLTHDDIVGSVDVLFLISSVSRAVDTQNPELVWDSLNNLNAHLSNLDKACKLPYYRALCANRYYKVSQACNCPLLTYQNIQECIDIVNEQSKVNDAIIESLHDLNAALLQNNKNKALKILKNPILNVSENISDQEDEMIYTMLLEQLEKQKNDSELWLEDIEKIIIDAKQEVEEIRTAWRFLVEVNAALANNDENGCLFALHENQILGNRQISNSSDIYKSLKHLHRKKTGDSPWISYITKKKHKVFIDMRNGNYECTQPVDSKKSEPEYLGKQEIEYIVSRSAKKKEAQEMEKCIINFQACCRGYLFREKLAHRLSFFEANEHYVRIIQRWWRNTLLLKKVKEINRLKNNHTTFIERLNYYQNNVDKIIKIQALWRGRMVRQALTTISMQTNPSFKIVRKFVPLLDFNIEDYRKEIELQSLRKQVVQYIRHSQELAKQIDEMDIKIGLLVQNRISLEEVVTHRKALNDVVNKRTNSTSTVSRGGLKSLQKESRDLLNGYQHLFYLLQTNPVYLSKLIFLVPYSRTQKLLQQLIFTLFNFGSSHRDEYLLLKLLRTSLEEEIQNKFDSVHDVITGNPLVLKVAVNYARHKFGQQSLRVILGPLIKKVLGARDMIIDTNPITIFRNWRSQQEMSTGKQSDLPLNVDQETALQYEEVRDRLQTAIESLKSLTTMFLNRITQSKTVIPYGLLYMAKILRSALQKKFPTLSEKDVLKVIGHLIYYQFFNSAIVAPDAFDIIPLEANKMLSNNHRNNLASIAKLLQFAASKKGFGEESKHLICLNPFIIECHEAFKKFFRDCCDVEELETYYSVTEFSEAILIHQPSIYITLEELCNTHNLLHEYEYQIAPDAEDPLHELLDDLGCEPPSVGQLMGLNPAEEIFNRHLGKTDLYLTLVNKFEVEENKEAVTEDTKLFIATKELLVRVMPFLNGHNLPGSLRIEPSPEQEREFEKRTEEILARHASNNCESNPDCYIGSLRNCKTKLRNYLNQLEEKGFVSRNDGYQSIISALAQDICNKRKYRKIQSQELQTVRETRKNLEDKICFYKDKVKYYNEYVQNCLENQKLKKNPHTLSDSSKSKSKKKLCHRFSAKKLKETGVLLEIEGLPTSQFKNVQFEISPAETNGMFKVKGKFMGVEMETVEVNLQDLLRKQYEGVTIMDMFGQAKININLLIFLLNKKFYS
nr:PREDICTED: ras GTPase-activating-like protein IQGAP1 [Bemisia tabaci]